MCRIVVEKLAVLVVVRVDTIVHGIPLGVQPGGDELVPGVESAHDIRLQRTLERHQVAVSPVGGQVVEEALAANRVVRGIGIGLDRQKNRSGGNARTNHEQDFADSLGGGKTGNIDPALPVVRDAERHRGGPVESVAIPEFRDRRKCAAQVGDLLDESTSRAFVVHKHVVVRSGIRDMKGDFLSLKHAHGSGVPALLQLPVPRRVLFVVGRKCVRVSQDLLNLNNSPKH